MNKDQLVGRLKQIGGQLTTVAGGVMRNPRLQNRGFAMQAVGICQMQYGDIRSQMKRNVGIAR